MRTMTTRVQLKEIDGRESQGACRQDELIGGCKVNLILEDSHSLR
jgi:hypothetical protein